MTTDSPSQHDLLTNAERARIDASTSGPVLLFFGSAAFWLVFGLVFETIASIQLILPWFLEGISFLTYGRMAQTASNIFAYGFATPAAIGIGIWLASRMSRVELDHHKLLTCAGIVWNLGVLVGACGILSGDSTSLPLLAIPGYATPILLLAYLLVAVWAVLTFFRRKESPLFAAEWFLFAGLLAFPWLFATASTLLVWNPVNAPAQPAIAYWFSSGFLNLWLAPIGIAAALYIIPKATGLPLASHHLNLLGFWTLLLFGSWTAGSHLIGGPVPASISGTGVAAAVMMVVPALAIGVNLHLTLSGHYDTVGWSPALRCLATAIGCLFSYWILFAINSLESVNAVMNFSDVNRGLSFLAFYGFFAMAAFGAIYYIVPRLTGREWACHGGIVWHYWLAAIGIGLIVIDLLLGGLIQAYALINPIVEFRSAVDFIWPFRFMAALGTIMLLLSAANFALLFAGILLDTRKNAAPAYLGVRAEDSKEPVAV
jgi:cytochrome c oxidase cbb3-type subunit 1